MEDYEINILRRDGNWKKVKSKDLLLDTIDQNEVEYNHIEPEAKVLSEHLKEENFLNDINEVNLIYRGKISLEEGGFVVIPRKENKLYLEHSFNNFLHFIKIFYPR